MTCGTEPAQWVGDLGTSAWSGTTDATPAVMILTALNQLAVLNIGTVPLVGGWAIDSGELLVNVALGGITYRLALTGTCDGAGKVVSAAGGAQDAFHNVHPVSLTRTI